MAQDLLSRLEQSATESLTQIETESREIVNADERTQQLHTQLEQALEEANAEAIQAHADVIGATVETVQSMGKFNNSGFVNAIAGLKCLAEAMTKQKKSLQALSPEEQRIIDDANTAVTRAEAEVQTVQDTFYFSKANKERDIAAKQKLMVDAKLAIPEAERRAKALWQERLVNSDFDQAIQEYVTLADTILTGLKEAKKKLAHNLEIDSRNKLRMLDMKDRAIKQRETLEKDIAQLGTELAAEQRKLASIPRNKDGYTEQEKAVTEAQRKLNAATARRNAVLFLQQRVELAAKAYEAAENNHIRLTGDCLTLEVGTESDKQEVPVRMRSDLEMLKQVAILNTAQNILDVGIQAFLDSIKLNAGTTSAVGQSIASMFEQHEGNMMIAEAAIQGQSESATEVNRRIEDAVKMMQERHGPSFKAVLTRPKNAKSAEESESDSISSLLGS